MAKNIITRNYSKDGIEVVISNVTLKGNLPVAPYAEQQRGDSKVTNFTVLANFSVNEDATVMGSIIEAVGEVCNFYGAQVPLFEHYLPVTFGAWDKESEKAQAELQKGTFIQIAGDIKVRMYLNKAGVRKLEIHMGNRATYRVLAKAKVSAFNAEEDVFPFAEVL